MFKVKHIKEILNLVGEELDAMDEYDDRKITLTEIKNGMEEILSRELDKLTFNLTAKEEPKVGSWGTNNAIDNP